LPISVDTHLGAQIVGADQQHIDPRHSGDLFGIGDRGWRLEHNDTAAEAREVGGGCVGAQRRQSVRRINDNSRKATYKDETIQRIGTSR
jgi:hypothetical protein